MGLQSPSGSSKVFGNFEAEKVSKLILLYDFSEFLQYWTTQDPFYACLVCVFLWLLTLRIPFPLGFKSFFNFKRLSESPWNITQIYRYVVDGKSQAETESDLPSDAVDESAATPIRKYMLRSKSVEKDVVIIDVSCD